MVPDNFKNVLIYVEPHPIRNTFVEFRSAGELLGRVLLDRGLQNHYRFKLFSNSVLLDVLKRTLPLPPLNALAPTDEEDRRILGYSKHWNKEAVDEWLSLVDGDGEVSTFYEGILRRLREEFEYNLILLWSENGAVRRFAREMNIPVVHCELGPTRRPFGETLYFDSAGTNGNASIYRTEECETAEHNLAPESWLQLAENSFRNDKVVGVFDAQLSVLPATADLHLRTPYVFVPMQLADDLNLLRHSDFSSPTKFLQHILPTYVELGYHVIIKGHPAAPSRPYNHRAELEALLYARSFGDRVIVVDRALNAHSTISIISGAAFVTTVNSSVGFEALLLGKRIVVLGRAVFWSEELYAAQGKSLIPTDEIWSCQFKDKLKKRINFLNGHYFLPRSAVTNGGGLIRLMDRAIEMSGSGAGLHANDEAWRKKFKYGFRKIGMFEEQSSSGSDEPSLGSQQAIEAAEVKYNRRSTEIEFSGLYKFKPIKFVGRVKRTVFFGHVDELSPTKGGLLVRGWALTHAGHLPPSAIYILGPNRRVAAQNVMVSRPDVPAALRIEATSLCGFQFQCFTGGLKVGDLELAIVGQDNVVQILPLKVGALEDARNRYRFFVR